MRTVFVCTYMSSKRSKCEYFIKKHHSGAQSSPQPAGSDSRKMLRPLSITSSPCFLDESSCCWGAHIQTLHSSFSAVATPILRPNTYFFRFLNHFSRSTKLSSWFFENVAKFAKNENRKICKILRNVRIFAKKKVLNFAKIADFLQKFAIFWKFSQLVL